MTDFHDRNGNSDLDRKMPVVGIRVPSWASFTRPIFKGIVDFIRNNEQWQIQTLVDSTNEMAPVVIDENWDGDWFTNDEEAAAGTDPLDYNDNPSDLPQTWLQQRLSSSGSYVVYVNWNAHEIAQKADFSDTQFDEQGWATTFSATLPVEIDNRSGLYGWTWGEAENEPHFVSGVSAEQVQSLLDSMAGSRFSASVV